MNMKRMIANVVEIVIGVVLLVWNLFGNLSEYWSGLGTALIFVGGLQLFRQIKYNTNETYRESVDLELNDERNKFLRMKAWAWAGYIFLLVSALAVFVFMIFGLDQWVSASAVSMGMMIALYLGSYIYLKKKY